MPYDGISSLTLYNWTCLTGHQDFSRFLSCWRSASFSSFRVQLTPGLPNQRKLSTGLLLFVSTVLVTLQKTLYCAINSFDTRHLPESTFIARIDGS